MIPVIGTGATALVVNLVGSILTARCTQTEQYKNACFTRTRSGNSSSIRHLAETDRGVLEQKPSAVRNARFHLQKQ